MIRIKQYNAAGRLIDSGLWKCAPNELHIVTFDVLIIGCVRVEYEA